MPPKKDTEGVESTNLITGFSDKECKLLAAAFISGTGTDKYDYELMATLTKNTVGSLKKMWPPVKKKAMEAHPSFATFLGQASTAGASTGEAKPGPTSKASGKKRKATDEDTDEKESDPTSDGGKSDNTKKKVAPKKAPAAKGKGRPKKITKKEPTSDDEAQAENSADGGDGMGQEIEDDA